MLCSYNPAQFCKDDWNKSVALNGFFYQKSLFTFGEEGLPFGGNQVSVKNAWAREHTADELTKSYVDKILNDASDYIFLDALGCVVPVAEITSGKVTTKVTYNKYMKEACKKLVRNKKICLGDIITDFSEADIRNYIGSFCDMLLTKYRQDQIIVHKANYAEWYDYRGSIVKVTDSVKKNRRHMGERLKLIYQVMEVHMPEAHFIDMFPTASAQSMNSPLNYSRQYAEYLTGSVLSIIYPENTIKYMQKAYAGAMALNGAPARIDGVYAELVQSLNDYQYKIEVLNRQIMQYDERISEACSSLAGISHKESVTESEELTYASFLDLKKMYIRRGKWRNSILWHIFVYPFTRIKRYFEYIHEQGFIKATRAAVNYYKNYIKDIYIIKKGEK